MTTSKYLSSVCYGLALGLGLFTAYVDSRGGPFHLFVTGLLLAFFGAILGFLQSQRVWRWALIIGGCVYIVFLTRRVFDSLSLNLLKAVPTFIPAFFGVYVGFFLRWVGFKLQTQEQKNANES